ncbi:MAG: DAK2 domain-containing protein [Clostridia bacterium]
MINGQIFRDAIISGANNIENNKQMINDLNVFPVPDGDTGTNMSLTIMAAKKDLKDLEIEGIGEMADKCASALLKGARGNSGVILSLLFRGFARELIGVTNANSADLARAFAGGVKSAYAAVMKPTEGTMLTVARVSSEQATIYAKKKPDEVSLFERIVEVASQTLDKTPEMLPVLKQANVVDAGGKGVLTIYEGMLSVFKDGKIIPLDTPEMQEEKSKTTKADFGSFNIDDIKFAYCTEFIVMKGKKCNADKLRSYLHTLGDSVVCVEDTDIVKVHLHTNNPGKALEEAVKHGLLTRMKIENMKEQQEQMAEEEAPTKAEKPKSGKLEKPAKAIKPIGVVAVCAGSGIAAVFKDLGADYIVEGGQTMNPSTDDIIMAVNSVPADTVIVFPNNKNIIMAARQAAELYKKKKIYVVPTKTVPQGVTALLCFSPEEDIDANIATMTDSIAGVRTGSITFAARDSVFDDKKIKEGEILGLIEGKIATINKDIEKCTIDIAKKITADGASFLTIFYGEDVEEKKATALATKLTNTLKCEVNVLYGGQPVYYYIISAE